MENTCCSSNMPTKAPTVVRRGTYAALRFSKDTIAALQDFVQDVKLVNTTDPTDYHSTLLYSRNYIVDYLPQGSLTEPWIGTDLQLRTLPTSRGETTGRCLVIVYRCAEQESRHKDLMAAHPQATWDFDEYNPHVTLCYKFDGSNDDVAQMGARLSHIKSLTIVEEYSEDLHFDEQENLEGVTIQPQTEDDQTLYVEKNGRLYRDKRLLEVAMLDRNPFSNSICYREPAETGYKMLFWPPLMRALLKGLRLETDREELQRCLPDGWSFNEFDISGRTTVNVCWVRVGRRFRVDEYDSYEYLVWEDTLNWHTT